MKEKTADILRDLVSREILRFKDLDKAAEILDRHFPDQGDLFSTETRSTASDQTPVSGRHGLGLVDGGIGPKMETKSKPAGKAAASDSDSAPTRKKKKRYHLVDPWARFSKALGQYQGRQVSAERLSKLARDVGHVDPSRPIKAFEANGRIKLNGTGTGYDVPHISALLEEVFTTPGENFDEVDISHRLGLSRSRVRTWLQNRGMLSKKRRA